MQAQDKGYNGWANYPTWAVNLWLSNEESLYNAAMEIAGRPVDLLGPESSYVYVEPADRRRRAVVADRFHAYVLDLVQGTATLATDLVGYAVGQVDWYEIADAWLESVDELTERPDSVLMFEGEPLAEIHARKRPGA
jgi:hypothetical protein